MSKHHLWVGAAFAALACSTPALAQSNSGEVQVADISDEIVVLGNSVRQVQTLRGAEMQNEAPGTSPIKLVERLPGVSFSSADAFGAYEWAVRINIRGFAQQQLGFTLDGIPLGDMSYGNFNGLHISRAMISENLGRVELSQGAGLLSTHSTSNLGGTLQFFTRGPQEEMGGVLALTGGDSSTFRGFARFDTGAIDGIGLRAYASYAHGETEKWTNGGQQNLEQWNVGFAQPLFGGELSGYYNTSERRETDFQDTSLDMIRRLGYAWDNFAPNWTLANQIADIANNRGDTGAPVTNAGAGTVYPAPIATVDDAYFDASGLRDDNLGRLTYETSIGDNIEVSGTIYKHDQEGQGIWFTPYVSPFSFGGGVAGVTSPISVRTTEYDMDRLGGFADLAVTLGAHRIETGFWLENKHFNQSRRFYDNTRAAPRPVLEFMRNPFATQWAFEYEIDTAMFYLQDTWDITDALTLVAGFKSVSVENNVVTLVNGFAAPVALSDADLRGSITSEDNFLPQVGMTYQVNDDLQVFASYTENMRDLGLAPFSNRSQISLDAIRQRTSPESSQTFEGGVRYRGDGFRGSAALYHVQFADRLLGIAQGAGIIGNPSIISNVGGVTNQGIELTGEMDFTDDLSLFVSYSYNDSTYDDNVVNALGAIVQATAGATVVNTPSQLLKADLTFDNDTFFATLSASYTGERESTYTNVGGQIAGHTALDLTGGYRFGGTLDGFELQLNVVNLLDEEYVSTIGSNGFSASDPGNTGQTLLVAPPRQVFVTLRKTF